MDAAQRDRQTIDETLLTGLLTAYFPQEKAAELAGKLIARFGSAYRTLCAEERDLCAVEGMTNNAAFYLKLQFNGCLRAMRETQDVTQDPHYRFSQIAVNMTGGRNEEALYLALLDRDMRLFDCQKIADGEATSVDIDARKIYRVVVESGRAQSAVLIHNHPSGNPTPSLEDVAATRCVRLLLADVGVKLYDHIVAGGGSAFSFVSAGLLKDERLGDVVMASVCGEPWERALQRALELAEC